MTTEQLAIAKQAIQVAQEDIDINLCLGDIDLTDADDFERTRDTVDDFVAASKEYADLAARHEFTVGETRCLALRAAQPFKGQRRSDVLIVDCGEFRFALKY